MKSVFNLKLILSYRSIIYIGTQIPREPDEERGEIQLQSEEDKEQLDINSSRWSLREEAPLGPTSAACSLPPFIHLTASFHPPIPLLLLHHQTSDFCILPITCNAYGRPRCSLFCFFPSRSPSFETLSPSVLLYQAFAKSTLSSNSHQCISNSLQSLTLLSFFFDLLPH